MLRMPFVAGRLKQAEGVNVFEREQGLREGQPGYQLLRSTAGSCWVQLLGGRRGLAGKRTD